jgi:hypothetical protein
MPTVNTNNTSTAQREMVAMPMITDGSGEDIWRGRQVVDEWL